MTPARSEDLIRLGFPYDTGGRGWVLVLKGYFDESFHGKNDQRIAAVAGYITTEKRWNQFARNWRDLVLRPFGLKTFHMADCEAGRGEFAGWAKDRRDTLMKIAIPIIRTWTLFGSGSAVVVKDYEELTHGHSKQGHPYLQSSYAFCFWSVMHWLLRDAKSYRSRVQPIALYFDRKERVAGQTKRYFDAFCRDMDKEERLVSLVYADDAQVVQLQAADVLAYETGKHLLNRLYDPKRPMRKSLEVLLAKKNLSVGYFDRNNLRPLIQRIKRDGWF